MTTAPGTDSTPRAGTAPDSGTADALPPVVGRLPGAQGATRLLSLAGVAFTASALWPQARTSAVPLVAVAVAALAAWTVLALLPSRVPPWPRIVLVGIMVVGGALAASFSNGVASVVLTVGVVVALGATAVPLPLAIGVSALPVAVIGISALVAPQPSQLVAAACAAGGALIGLARRQARTAAERERQTTRRLIEAHRALAESAARDERARIARDLHDVLAHTLGGLVVQLDAVEGLAEAGRVDEAVTRARAARELAADGLRDARVVVGVLDGTRSVELSDLAEQVRRLVAAERQVGTAVVAHVDDLHGVANPALIDAFREAARESLTNARKHAPGAEVRLRLSTERRMLTLEVANDVLPGAASRPELATSGSGRGLAGIRARMDALPDGSVSIESSDSAFTLTITARTS